MFFLIEITLEGGIHVIKTYTNSTFTLDRILMVKKKSVIQIWLFFSMPNDLNPDFYLSGKAIKRTTHMGGARNRSH